MCVVALWAAVSGCGTAPTQVGFSAAQYANKEYGFSIQYPAGFSEVVVPRDATKPGAPQFQVLFADPQGTQVGGQAVDVLEAAVYKMNAVPKEADFTGHRKDFEAMLVQLVGKMPGFEMAAPPAWTTVSQRPAVTITYTYTLSGQDLAASAELVFKDAQAYLVRAQAGRAVWATTGRELVSCMATFEFL